MKRFIGKAKLILLALFLVLPTFSLYSCSIFKTINGVWYAEDDFSEVFKKTLYLAAGVNPEYSLTKEEINEIFSSLDFECYAKIRLELSKDGKISIEMYDTEEFRKDYRQMAETFADAMTDYLAKKDPTLDVKSLNSALRILLASFGAPYNKSNFTLEAYYKQSDDLIYMSAQQPVDENTYFRYEIKPCSLTLTELCEDGKVYDTLNGMTSFPITFSRFEA